MGLQLLLGRSGTGKSEYIYKEIKGKIDGEQKIYIITPEQFSFTAEKKLLEIIGRDAIINAEVINFNRIATRIFTEIGGLTKTHLSKCGRVMLIYDILIKNKNKLNFLSCGEKNISVVLNAINEFKKHNITDLEPVISGVQDEYLKIKLNDLHILYSAFEESIKNKYIDENDVLSILARELEDSKMFDNTLVYIDEFLGFTSQEYDVIREILKKADKVSVALTTDVKEDENLDMLNPNDIFYEPKKTASKLIKKAREARVEVEKSIFFKEAYRFKNSELKFIEKNIDKLVLSTEYTKKVENVNVFLSKNSYSEVEFLARSILKLVREYGYEYNDISVITKNMDNYSSLIKAIFAKFNIPVFIDENADMNDNLIAKFIVSILDIIDKNWDHEAIFNYMKNPFSGYKPSDVFLLEKYVIKWGIKNKKWLEKWNFDDRDTVKLEAMRNKFVSKILQLKDSCKKKAENTQEKNLKNQSYGAKILTKALYLFLIEDGLEERVNKEILELEKKGLIELANEYKACIQSIFNVFDEIVMIFDAQEIGFNRYKELLKIGFENVSTGKIPAVLDNVVVGDIDRSKSHKVKVLFLIGLNDGVFPASAKNEGFLNDEDRNILKNMGLELASDTFEQLYQEQFNVYKAFSIAEEKLILTYVSSDKEGKALRPSSLINKIKKFFPLLEIDSDVVERKSEITLEKDTFEELLMNLRKFQDGEKIDKIWFEVYNWFDNSKKWKGHLKKALDGLEYTNLSETLNYENINKLYGDTLKTSVSRLEQYRSCPFSYYLKYGLKLQEEQELSLKPIDTGSFMHEVIDEFFKEYQDIYLREVSDEEIEKSIYDIIDRKLALPKNYIFNSTPKFMNMTLRLKKVIANSIKYIVYQLKNSSFKILGNELEFKEGKDYPPIELELESGEKVEITGKIDRVDIAKLDDNQYIRIVDYKSSVKNIDLNKVVNGLQIQLLTYLDSITKIEDVLPAGVMYFNLIEPMLKEGKNLTDEEIEAKIRSQFKMKGLILADVKIVRMMDNRLQTGKSDIIAAEISSKDEKLSERGGNPITAEEFEKLQRQVMKTIKEISTEILKGKIDIKPYKNGKKTPCEYCSYRSICRFNTNIKGNEYFKIPKKKKREILDEI